MDETTDADLADHPWSYLGQHVEVNQPKGILAKLLLTPMLIYY